MPFHPKPHNSERNHQPFQGRDSVYPRRWGSLRQTTSMQVSELPVRSLLGSKLEQRGLPWVESSISKRRSWRTPARSSVSIAELAHSCLVYSVCAGTAISRLQLELSADLRQTRQSRTEATSTIPYYRQQRAHTSYCTCSSTGETDHLRTNGRCYSRIRG
jgi:hypothetical protein